jgi:RNase P subunit RPR2
MIAGKIWKAKHCKECNLPTPHYAKVVTRYVNNDIPEQRWLLHECSICSHVKRVDITKRAQLEWTENAVYCASNFTNYITLKDAERAVNKE